MSGGHCTVWSVTLSPLSVQRLSPRSFVVFLPCAVSSPALHRYSSSPPLSLSLSLHSLPLPYQYYEFTATPIAYLLSNLLSRRLLHSLGLRSYIRKDRINIFTMEHPHMSSFFRISISKHLSACLVT